MLICREVMERASRIQDADLALGEMLRARAHLLVCRHCARYLEQMRATAGLLRTVGREAVAENAEALLVARMAAAYRRAQVTMRATSPAHQATPPGSR